MEELSSCPRQIVVEFSVPVCYNASRTQGSYIGNTTASQAVKAGSIPVPCSKKHPTPVRVWDIFLRLGKRESNPSNATVRGTVACEGWTEQLLNFLQGRKCKSIPVPCPKEEGHPIGMALFLSECY